MNEEPPQEEEPQVSSSNGTKPNGSPGPKRRAGYIFGIILLLAALWPLYLLAYPALKNFVSTSSPRHTASPHTSTNCHVQVEDQGFSTVEPHLEEDIHGKWQPAKHTNEIRYGFILKNPCHKPATVMQGPDDITVVALGEDKKPLHDRSGNRLQSNPAGPITVLPGDRFMVGGEFPNSDRGYNPHSVRGIEIQLRTLFFISPDDIDQLQSARVEDLEVGARDTHGWAKMSYDVRERPGWSANSDYTGKIVGALQLIVRDRHGHLLYIIDNLGPAQLGDQTAVTWLPANADGPHTDLYINADLTLVGHLHKTQQDH